MFASHARAKVIVLSLVISIFIFAPSVYADGPAALTRSPWQMYRNPIITSGVTYFGNHGDIRYYQYAPPIPAVDASVPLDASGNGGWTPAPNGSTIGFGDDGASRLRGYPCLQSLDFTFFQTLVDIPQGTILNDFKISFSGMDDGSRVSIFNSANPAGIVIDGSYVYLGGSGTTDLKAYIVAGETNRVVITQMDDCAVGNKLQVANVVLNGTVVQADAPPVAKAGPDQTVAEQQQVLLNGSASSDPDGDALTYQWLQIGGAAATLYDDTTATPSFAAPFVGLGGETLTFQLIVTANGLTSTDQVDVTVANINHAPVALAGNDQSVAEGAPVTLAGSASFDIDGDAIAYSWQQVGGPAVALTGPASATPVFTAPIIGNTGDPGVVATLVFKLTVDDGYPADAPADGYQLSNVVDTVTVQITNVNNEPVANAGPDQASDENGAVLLNGAGSSDPDGDALSYAWTQTSGPTVALNNASTANPSFMTPFVSAGGADLVFNLTVDDGYGGAASDTVIVHVQNANDPPLVSAAQPTVACLWAPDHRMVSIGITGVSDPDNNATITITGVRQDEPANGLGDGDTAVDAIINGSTVLLRAERSGKGNGRVYHVMFTASDLEGSVNGAVTVCVQHDRNKPAIDGGDLFDSTN